MRGRSLASFAAFAVLLVPACSSPGASTGATGTPADEAAIREMAGKYAAAYSKHDTAALGSMLTDDYEEVDPTGVHNQGRAATVAAAAKDFAMMPVGTATMAATTTFVHWISANAAVAAGTWTMTGMPPGQPTRGAWIGTVVKKDSTWKMVSTLGSADVSTMMMADTMKPKAK